MLWPIPGFLLFNGLRYISLYDVQVVRLDYVYVIISAPSPQQYLAYLTTLPRRKRPIILEDIVVSTPYMQSTRFTSWMDKLTATNRPFIFVPTFFTKSITAFAPCSTGNSACGPPRVVCSHCITNLNYQPSFVTQEARDRKTYTWAKSNHTPPVPRFLFAINLNFYSPSSCTFCPR